MVTMVTTPKSAGVSRRARTTVPTTWSCERQPRSRNVAAAPRTARRRNSPLPATGLKAPLASNGIIPSLGFEPDVHTHGGGSQHLEAEAT